MNSSYLNAMAGAFLAVVFVVLTVSIAADAIFHSEAPEKEGYELVALEGGAATEAAPSSDGLPPIAPLLAGASVDGGMKAFRKCAACHTVDDGGANKVGPNLWNIVDRPIAAATGFGYSSSMTDYADGGANAWDYEHLNGFLAAPKKYIKGTAMGFAGLKKEAERADVIAYLRSLSDNPAPLPSDAAEPEAAEPASAEPAAAEPMAAEPKATEPAADTGDTDDTDSTATE
jgi:cytochrome c